MDNLFVFLVIMTAFVVPAIHQHRVLLVGILIALALRGSLIMLDAALINQFTSVFYLFGVFLIYTAVRLVRTPGTIDRGTRIRGERRATPVTASLVSSANVRVPVGEVAGDHNRR